MGEKCCCKSPGWCDRHQMMKVGKLFELCQAETEQGEKMREIWDTNVENNTMVKPNAIAMQGCGAKGKCANVQTPPKREQKNIVPATPNQDVIQMTPPKREHKDIIPVTTPKKDLIQTPPKRHEPIKETPKQEIVKQRKEEIKANAKKLLLVNQLCPGDILVMSGAIESLHHQYPGKYAVDIRTSCNEIYEHSPRITKLDAADPAVQTINMEYPLINSSNQRPVHFLQGYVDFLASTLNIPLYCSVNKPSLYFSPDEMKMKSQVETMLGKKINYWVINAGTKRDYTTKGWGAQNYQKVVDELQGKIQFVQVGEKGHVHKPLNNVINFIGKTTSRQLIRLCLHAQGGLGPITFIQHIFAALQKPYVAMLGGRESLIWEHYLTQTMMSTLGCLPCCSRSGCWRSRVVPLGDNDAKDKSLCEFPVVSGGEMIPKCLAMIGSQDVVRAIERYYQGGILSY